MEGELAFNEAINPTFFPCERCSITAHCIRKLIDFRSVVQPIYFVFYILEAGMIFCINGSEGTYPSFLWALAIRNIKVFLIAKGHYFIIKQIDVDDSILSCRFASSRILWQAYDWEKSNVPGTCCWFIPNPNVPSPASVGRRSCISSSSSTPKYVSRILMHFS